MSVIAGKIELHAEKRRRPNGSLRLTRLVEPLWGFSVFVCFRIYSTLFLSFPFLTFLSPISPSPVQGSKPDTCFPANLPAFVHTIPLSLQSTKMKSISICVAYLLPNFHHKKNCQHKTLLGTLSGKSDYRSKQKKIWTLVFQCFTHAIHIIMHYSKQMWNRNNERNLDFSAPSKNAFLKTTVFLMILQHKNFGLSVGVCPMIQPPDKSLATSSTYLSTHFYLMAAFILVNIIK